mmetsp:Transcript_6984/g.11668  ORF Transcript_6984/g.11668 Transcript_6984/m.11668 type:complete len:207 (-) Transcript_6984:247-867(-)|eukprot:CAMPEP_0114431104 /NCGR_PEP_ID=MMETSP0103-20121206/10415_1 /TAXON_ID=37642 ORGANISM="Paraphysomonas imperforata, Strain PA2" /NCGR_SAMPLE_ID=MMETSP0103 /ASSEMBLY_ACC=CAM_ASM_000201 /LENGTH=206 /DNA_ID=CAMNT_0001600633 /DNA_START=30 /DNA_END=650 /DNA_ORIENTATION=-
MDSNNHVSVSDSQFWKSWRESKVYKLQVSVLSGEIMLSAKSDLKPSQLDPYLVVFLAKDREHSKKKTQVLKRTSNPVWNECICFSDLDYTEKICFELKIPTFSMSNPLLAQLTFTVQELLQTPLHNMNDFTYELTSTMTGVKASVRLGFKFDTPLVGVEAVSDASTSVFLNCHDAFASFVFFRGAASGAKEPMVKFASDDESEDDY